MQSPVDDWLKHIGKESSLDDFSHVSNMIAERVANAMKQSKDEVNKELAYISEFLERPKPEVSEVGELAWQSLRWSAEGIKLAISEYISNPPKDSELKETSEEKIKKTLLKAYEHASKYESGQKDALEDAIKMYKEASRLILGGVKVSRFINMDVPIDNTAMVRSWMDGLVRYLEKAKRWG
ncbi:MAG: hypothetical protein QXT63_02770 [Thermoplasmata archaeon]